MMANLRHYTRRDGIPGGVDGGGLLSEHQRHIQDMAARAMAIISKC